MLSDRINLTTHLYQLVTTIFHNHFDSISYFLKKADGKSSVVNIEWREKLNTICDMLVALRKRLKIAKDTGAYSLYGEDDVMYCFYDRDLAIWFDSTREEILKILSSICEEIGIHGLGFPRKRYEW